MRSFLRLVFFIATLSDVDADVNALYAVAGQPRALGFKVNLEAEPLNMKVDDVVQNVLDHKLVELRHNEFGMDARMQKMRTRGWTVSRIQDAAKDAVFVPNAGLGEGATLVRVPKQDQIFKNYDVKFRANGGHIVDMHRVSCIFFVDSIFSFH